MRFASDPLDRAALLRRQAALRTGPHLGGTLAMSFCEPRSCKAVLSS